MMPHVPHVTDPKKCRFCDLNILLGYPAIWLIVKWKGAQPYRMPVLILSVCVVIDGSFILPTPESNSSKVRLLRPATKHTHTPQTFYLQSKNTSTRHHSITTQTSIPQAFKMVNDKYCHMCILHFRFGIIIIYNLFSLYFMFEYVIVWLISKLCATVHRSPAYRTFY